MKNYCTKKCIFILTMPVCVFMLLLLTFQTKAQNRSQPAGQKNTKVNNQMSTLKPDA